MRLLSVLYLITTLIMGMIAGTEPAMAKIENEQCSAELFPFECSIPEITETCIPCDVLNRLLIISEQMGGQVFDAIRGSVQAFIGIVLALVLLGKAAQLLFPFAPLDRTQALLASVVSRTGMSLLIVLTLSSFTNYWQYIHQPVLKGAVGLTNSLMGQVEYETAVQESRNTLLGTSKPPNWMQPENTIMDVDICSDALDAPLGESIECVVRRMQNGIGQGLDAGLEILIEGIPDSAWYDWFAMFTMFACGAVLIIVFGIPFLAFPMKIADVIIRWTLFSILSPLILAALIYPATRSFFISGIKGLFQACLELVMIGLVIALAGFAIYAIGDWKEAMVGLDNATLKVPLMNSIVFWQLVLIGLALIMMIGKAKSFANDIAGASFNTDVAGETTDKVTSAAGVAQSKAGNNLKSSMDMRGWR